MNPGPVPDPDPNSDPDPDPDPKTETEHARARDQGDFTEFWQAYPKKAAKKDAQKAWVQTAKERPPLDELLGAIKKQMRSRQWQDGVYPHAATWLRGERWHDEPERGPSVGRPQPTNEPVEDTGPPATPEQRADALKQIRRKLGMNPFQGGTK